MEIWKDIQGYEGLYQVSNTGIIKSLKRYRLNHGKTQEVPEKIKKYRKDPQGYLQCDLFKNNNAKTVRAHRIVALAFLPNPQNKETVNHIDGNKENNHVENLEWATFKEQNNHFYKNNLKSRSNIRKAVKAMNDSQAKKVRCINTGEIFPSASYAAKKHGITPSHLMAVCRKVPGRKTAGKNEKGERLRWEYVK